MTTIKEMLNDGWKRRTIKGVRVLQCDEFGLIVNGGRREALSPTDMLTVIDVLGKPDKIHTADGVIVSLEYFEIAELFGSE